MFGSRKVLGGKLFVSKHCGFSIWPEIAFFSGNISVSAFECCLSLFLMCLNWLLWSFGIVGYSDMFQTIDLPIIELSVSPACTTSWNKYNFLYWFESTSAKGSYLHGFQYKGKYLWGHVPKDLTLAGWAHHYDSDFLILLNKFREYWEKKSNWVHSWRMVWENINPT